MIERMNSLVALPVTDMARARAFYGDILGFQPLLQEEGFVIFDTGATQLAIHLRGVPLPDPDLDGIWVWVEVDDIDAARAALEEQAVRFVGEKAFLGPGWEQPFLDSEGNVLRLWEPLREVRRSLAIEAPPEAVFAALTDARAVEKWFSAIDDVALEAKVGGRVSFVDPLFGRVEGVVESLVPARRLAFTFHQNWPRTLVFEIEPRGTGSILEVRQTGFDQIRDRDYYIHHEVANLESALEALSREVGNRMRAD